MLWLATWLSPGKIADPSHADPPSGVAWDGQPDADPYPIMESFAVVISPRTFSPNYKLAKYLAAAAPSKGPPCPTNTRMGPVFMTRVMLAFAVFKSVYQW